jgi:hypothetical protein
MVTWNNQPYKENLFHVILMKDSTNEYLQIQHEIVLIIKITSTMQLRIHN